MTERSEERHTEKMKKKQAAHDKIMASKGDAVKAREELAAQYEAEVADGVNAAVEGLVDDVIDPADSRKMVIAALEILSSKRDSNPPKKHGNMPL